MKKRLRLAYLKKQLEDVDLSLIRLACLAERALTLSLTGWPEIS